MKRLGLAILIILLLVTGSVLALGYHGPRVFDEGVALPQTQDVVKSARELKGVPYDPLMGMYDNIGGRAGFIVCSDVPNIAYGIEGYSWKKVLESDFIAHPGEYETSNGNNPKNPYFHRRARNLFSYFKANKRLIGEDYQPSPGDMVFYRKTKNGFIAHVTLVTEIKGDSYYIMESAPKTFFAQEVDDESPIKRGWIFAGFGKVYE